MPSSPFQETRNDRQKWHYLPVYHWFFFQNSNYHSKKKMSTNYLMYWFLIWEKGNKYFQFNVCFSSEEDPTNFSSSTSQPSKQVSIEFKPYIPIIPEVFKTHLDFICVLQHCMNICVHQDRKSGSSFTVSCKITKNNFALSRILKDQQK